MIATILAQVLAPDMTSIEIYRRAVAAMHAITAPSYLRYETDVTTAFNAAEIRQHVAHVERTNPFDDALTVVREEQKDAKGFRAKAFEIAPDLFLGHGGQTTVASPSQTLESGLDDANQKPLKTIAVVSVPLVHYEVSTVATESLPNCQSAFHLKLVPRESPRTYNLRDLWVESATFKICRAVGVWIGRVNWSKALFSITLDLDANGFIEHFATAGTVRTLFFGSILTKQDATYSSLEPVDAAVWSAAKTRLPPKPTP